MKRNKQNPAFLTAFWQKIGHFHIYLSAGLRSREILWEFETEREREREWENERESCQALCGFPAAANTETRTDCHSKTTITRERVRVCTRETWKKPTDHTVTFRYDWVGGLCNQIRLSISSTLIKTSWCLDCTNKHDSYQDAIHLFL